MYSETCANGHLYSETTSIKRPHVPKVSAQYNLTSIQRPPLYKGHCEVTLAWLFNTGFTVHSLLKFVLSGFISAIFDEIRATGDRVFDDGTFHVADFYTEDCVMVIPGVEPLKGHEGYFMHSIHIQLGYISVWLICIGCMYL